MPIYAPSTTRVRDTVVRYTYYTMFIGLYRRDAAVRVHDNVVYYYLFILPSSRKTRVYYYNIILLASRRVHTAAYNTLLFFGVR